ncbi:sensor histidine kinase [Cohnella sp. REN36]|uniref:cache domain-containing sensor histidine kinase n=1 Tax=Cohnella sp. REN36 TaxID=2887347 RepID=UPI001D145B59|nr:sensor histidine kinase [Cohnella sp. REN36]MCC3371966.1 sensor histidine kinase [Cohnella sp. REN36]
MIRNASRFVSIRTKFLILFGLMITLPFLLSGFLTYQRYSSNVERDAQAYSEQISEQVAINLERYVQDMDRITLSIYYDSGVMAVLNRHKDPGAHSGYLTVSEVTSINELISSQIIERTELEGVFIFALDGSLFSNLLETVQRSWETSSNSWMEQAKRKDGGLVILPPENETYYRDAPKQVLSLARLIKEPTTNKDLGYVKIDLTSDGFEKILSSVKVTDNSKLFVFNDDFRQLYPFDEAGSASYRSIADAPSDRWLISKRSTNYGGLTIVSAVPRDDVLADARQLTSFTLWISAAALVLAYLLAVLTSNNFVKPIKQLLNRMRRVQNGDFEGRAKVISRDEVGLLTEGFNTMVSQLNIMIKDIYELRLREKDAALSALLSQMNPHFLYNTLESISMAAHREKHESLSEVIASLGKLLRYTVNNKERSVHLQDELAFVESYLNIQAFRLEDRLQFDIVVDFAHELAIVPKLILQPLVENAIEHGLGEEPIKVTLVSKVSGQDLLLCVRDNGRGIDPARLQEIQRNVYEPEPPVTARGAGKRTKGFALRNIHQRLRLLYGEPYGLEIEASHAGVSIHVHMPFQWEEDGNHEDIDR